MEDIEYLEEYRDLVLPALNSAAAEAAASSVLSESNKNLQNQKINDDGEDSSSSIDQDIFNCLFDDNSDDDDFNSGEKVVEKVEISRQVQSNNFNTTTTAKKINKVTSSIAKPKAYITKTSATTEPLNTKRPSTASEKKAKSIATVRPTIQNRKQQHNLSTKSNLLQRQVSSSKSSIIQRQIPTTSATSTSSSLPVELPILTRKPISSVKQQLSTSVLGNNKKAAAPSFSNVRSTTIGKRSATIVKPEKIITKDPVNDPLELDDFSEGGSVADNDSFSDISGETYNFISNFEDDDDSNDEYYSGNDSFDDVHNEDDISSSSHVIELSNDSSCAPSNLEDFRAPTPSPIISDESDTSSNSSGLIISKNISRKPYSHPDIIEGVLTKNGKPKLLELLRTHNLLDDSLENNEGENIVIDITASRENLAESLHTQQPASSKKTLPSSITTPITATTATATTETATATTIDSVSIDLNLTESDKTQTISLKNKKNTTVVQHSKRTNKNKTKKKKVKNMDDYRNLNSPGTVSTDSDLSAVEELLEESYAEAMKRVKDLPLSAQDVEAEMEIGGEEEIAATELSKAASVVIDCDKVYTDDNVKTKKIEETETKNMTQSDTDKKEVDQKKSDINEPEGLLKSETKANVEIEDKAANKVAEPLEQILGKNVIDGEDSSRHNENIPENSLNSNNSETAKQSACDSPNSRKKKRFRNLLTPDPTEWSLETAKSIDDIKDFEGFDEVQTAEKVAKEIKNNNLQFVEVKGEKTPEKDSSPGSFKSPSKSHQSSKEKLKETKDKNPRDSLKESKDKNSAHNKSKSSRDNSKDRSSTHNSSDKSSRENSKDRSRESSKDRSRQHFYDKESNSKHHHKDHRKSSDSSKDSSKSRESSKSRDSKETKHTKSDSKDSLKSSTVKKEQSSEGNKEKISKETDKHAKHIAKSSTSTSSSTSSESKNSKDRDSKKEHKSSSEKRDSKPLEMIQKRNDSHKSSSSLTTKYDQNKSRDPSKDRKDVNKTVDSTKGSIDSKKSDHSKNQKTTDLNKSVTSTTSKTNVKPTEVLKSLKDTKTTDKNVQRSGDERKSNAISSNDSNLSINNDTPAKKEQQKFVDISKDSKTSKTDVTTPKSTSKSNESDKKDQQKTVKDPSSDSRKAFVKREDVAKKAPADLNKSVNEKKESSKVPTKSDHLNKTKKETPVKQISKESTAIKCSTQRSESATKISNVEAKDISATKSTVQNEQNLKTPARTDDLKSEEKPTETSNTAGSIQRTIVDIKAKEAKKTSMSPKPKQENIKKTEASNLNTNESTKVTKKDSNPPISEKTNTPPDIRMAEKTTDLEKAKTKYSQETTNLEKSQNRSEKKTIVKRKNDANNTIKKDVSSSKSMDTNLSQGNKISAHNQQAANTELKEITLKVAKETTHLAEQRDDSESEKNKDLQAFPSEQKKIEQEKRTEENNEPRKSQTSNDSATPKGKTPMTANKNKVEQSKTAAKPVDSTTKSVLSPKVIKKPQKTIAAKSESSDKTVKPQDTKESNIKRVSNVQEKKVEVKKTVVTVKLQDSCVETNQDIETNRSLVAAQLQNSVVADEPMETKDAKQNVDKEIKENEKIVKKSSDIKPESKTTSNAFLKTIKLKDTTIREAVTDNQMETKDLNKEIKEHEKNVQKSIDTKPENQAPAPSLETKKLQDAKIRDNQVKPKKSKETVNKQIGQHEKNVKKPSKTELESTETEQPGEKILKSIEKPAIQKNEPESARSHIMKHGLKKSVVILLEPLKLIQSVHVNAEDGVDTEPRRTRSRIDIGKCSSSPTKEEFIKGAETIAETETRKAKRCREPPTPEKADKNKNNVTQSEESNVEQLMQTTKRSTSKTQAVVSEIDAAKETSNVLTKESSSSSEIKISTTDVRTKNNIEEKNLKAIQTRRCGDVKSETEKGKGKISHNDMPKESSTPKETVEHIDTKKVNRRAEGKVLSEKVMEDDSSKPIKTRRRGVLAKVTESEKGALLQESSCEEKISAEEENKEDHNNESIKTEKHADVKEESGKEMMHSESLGGKSSVIIETKKLNVEKTKVRDSKLESNEKKETSQIEESLGEKVSNTIELKAHIEPIKTRKRGDLKEPSEKDKCEASLIESSDLKAAIEKEVGKEKNKTSEFQQSSEKISVQKELDSKSEKEKNETEETLEVNVKTNQSSSDLKVDLEEEKMVKSQKDSSNEKCATLREADEFSFELIKSKECEDLKEFQKEKTNNSQVEQMEKSLKRKETEEHCTSTKSRKTGDLEEDIDRAKSKTAPIKSSGETRLEQKEIDHLEPPTTVGRVEQKEGDGNDKNEILNEKSSELKEVDEHFVPIKTRRRGERKEETGKQQRETLHVDFSNEESSADKAKVQFEPKKLKRRADLETESIKEKSEDKSSAETSSSETEKKLLEERKEVSQIETSDEKAKDDNVEPLKTRGRGDLKPKSSKEKSATCQNKSKDEVSSDEKDNQLLEEKNEASRLEISDKKDENLNFEPIKTRRRVDLKTKLVDEKSAACQDKSNDEISSAETKKDLLEERNDLSQAVISDEKSSAENKSEELNFEPLKTRTRGDLKTKSVEVKSVKYQDKSIDEASPAETKKELLEGKTEVSQAVISNEKSSAENRAEELDFELIKTKTRVDLKTKSVEAKSATCQDKSNDETSPAETKKELLEGKTEVSQIEITDEKGSAENKPVEPIKTRKRGDLKTKSVEDKSGTHQNKSNDATSSVITNKVLLEEKKEVSQIKISDEKNSDENKVEALNFEPIKTRKRDDFKTKSVEEKSGTCQDKLIDLASRAETKKDLLEEKKEVLEISNEKHSVQNKGKEFNFEPIKRRRRGDLKTESAEEKSGSCQDKSNEAISLTQIEKVVDHTEKKIEISDEKRSGQNKVEVINLEPTKTRRPVDFKTEHKKETQMPQVDPTEGKSFEQKEDLSESFKKIRRVDLKDEAAKDKIEISNVELSKEISSSLITEEPHFGTRITRSRGDLKEDARIERDIISKGGNLQPSKNKNDDDDILKKEAEENIKLKVINRGDDTTHSEKEKIQISKGICESKASHLENIISTVDENLAVKVKTEILTDGVVEQAENSCKVICLDTDMSGSESSSITSSYSDSTLRRILRKRGSESPFRENDNKKRPFKEPQLKSATHFTSRGSKTEKASTNVFISGYKRPLRSPAVDSENPTSTKKPKLDTSPKSTRCRSAYDDCLQEEELPMTAREVGLASKERRNFNEQSAVLSKRKSNEPGTIVLKSTQDKNKKEAKEITTDKKARQKVEHAKTPQTSVNISQKDPLLNETPKEHASKEAVNTDAKSNVSVKKILCFEEKQQTNKQEKQENVAKTPEASNQSRTNKTNKSPSSVMTFSDWLINKKQNTDTEGKEEFITDTTNESTPDILMRQSRVKAKVTPKILDDPKSTKVKEKAVDEAKVPHVEKEQQPVLEGKQEPTISPAEDDQKTMDVPQVLSESLPRPLENQLQNAVTQRKVARRNKRTNVKRLQKEVNIQQKLTKSNTPPSMTSPRMKKSETDLLIEAMSKEMKDGGIKDLLKSETHVKRQRLASKRNIGDRADFADNLGIASNVLPSKEVNRSPKKGRPQQNTTAFTENLRIASNISSSKEIIKFPNKRKPQQNSADLERLTLKSSKSDILNTTPHIEQNLMQEDSKVMLAKSRKSLNIKELPSQVEKSTTEFMPTNQVKLKNSLPLMSKELLIKDTNVTTKKSVAQRQPTREQREREEKSVFKTPKQVGPPIIMNLLPQTEGISKLYADDKKRTENRIKMNQTESLLKTFKCRKLRVHLDRSVVETYLNSINKREKETLTKRRKVIHDVSGMPPRLSNTLPIIKNNSQTSLRIQSVIDASKILSTASSTIISNTRDSSASILQDSSVASISMPAISQQSYILSNREDISAPLHHPIINAADANETIELKNEFMDENPIGLMNDAILPDTPTLLARAQSITEAAQHALSNSITPTDIRLVTADNLENNFVPSFGVTPTALDNRGTCMYTFLHPAKYNRNHSNVLLDYCCPNLDGPMPAIDPTRIHAQVQLPVIELPSAIVLTTKVVTRADLDSQSSCIPAIIRKKAEKIRKNMATHHKLAVTTTTTAHTPPQPQPPPPPIVPAMTQPHLTPAPRHTLPPTINALTKQLPSTTTITAKIRPPATVQGSQSLHAPSSVASNLPKSTIVSVIPKGHLPHLSSVQHSSLRSNLRRFDVLLKQLIKPYESLTFVNRHRVIEAVITSGKILPQDLDQTLVLMEEYIKQTLLLKNSSLNRPQASSTSAILSTSNYITSQSPISSALPVAQMPQLQPSPKILASAASLATQNAYSRQLEQVHHNDVSKVQCGSKNTSVSSNAVDGTSGGGVVVKQKQVPIYDTDRNIIGYQMRMMAPMTTMPAFTKSTMSTYTGAIMSTSLDSGSSQMTERNLNKRPLKRPNQDSPRVFYTTPPLKTSTPKAVTNSNIYPTQQSRNAKAVTQKTQGTIISTLRSGGSASSSNSADTLTTTTTATVKRITRSTATGSKIIIVSKSNQSSEESILPDTNSNQLETEQTEIKNEKDID